MRRSSVVRSLLLMWLAACTRRADHAPRHDTATTVEDRKDRIDTKEIRRDVPKALTSRVLPADSTTNSDSTYGTYGEKPAIFIVIGRTTIPVGADSSFEQLKRPLPKPSLLPPEDPDDHMHSNDRYCYAFAGGFLVFEDTHEGIWKASLMRSQAVPKMTACPAIEETPTIRIGDLVLSIDVPATVITDQSFPGFRRVKRTAHMLQRNWWHVSQVSDGRTGCSLTGIDINFAVRDSALIWINVATGGEGWDARRVERSEGSRDSLWTCRTE